MFCFCYLASTDDVVS